MTSTKASSRRSAGSSTQNDLGGDRHEDRSGKGGWSESPWNYYLDLLLAQQLPNEQLRLALALARNIIGFNRAEERLGRSLLQQEARLHGRSFERARDGLEERGLLEHEPGRRGRGGRALYRLPVGHLLNAAHERHLAEPREKAALERHLDPEKAAEKAAENAAPQRQRDKGEGKNSKPPPLTRAREADGGGGVLTESEPDAFTEAVREHALGPKQRREWLSAFTENEPGFLKNLRELEGDSQVRTVVGAMTERLRAGAHRLAGKATPTAFRAVLVRADGTREEHGVYSSSKEAEDATYEIDKRAPDGTYTRLFAEAVYDQKEVEFSGYNRA